MGKSAATDRPCLRSLSHSFTLDLVVLHADVEVVKRCREILTAWLQPMGLELKESKTRITHTLQAHEGNVGFDFLGCHIRQYPVGHTHRVNCGSAYGGKKGMLPFKTLITPSQRSIQTHYREMAATISRHNAAPQAALIRHLNPRIRGWCAYFSPYVSKRAFAKLDHLVTHKLLRWAKRRHPRKGGHWCVGKYFRSYRQDADVGSRWRFASKEGAGLVRHADTKIRRHVLVNGQRSLYDGDWSYWGLRLARHPLLSPRVSQLLKRQHGKCASCGLYFKEGDLPEVDRITPGKQGGKYIPPNLQLLHRHCHNTKTRQDGTADNGHVTEEPCERENSHARF
jgi:RNA-directed DNA polymerase